MSNQPDAIDMLTEALKLVEEDELFIFPVDEKKFPLIAGGHTAASNDPAQIRRWWTQWPSAGIGAPTGELNGFIVIDLDLAPAKGKKPAKNGIASLEALSETLGELPDTAVVLTGGGGFHLYFLYDSAAGEIRSSVSSLGKHIDVRAEGGYVVLPPTLHQSGKRYCWQEDDAEPAELPSSWRDRLVAKASKPFAKKRQSGFRAPSDADALQMLRYIMRHNVVRWAAGNPDAVGRELWIGFSTNIAAAVLDNPKLLDIGEEAFHIVSRGHSNYTERETRYRWRETINEMNLGKLAPMTFSRMTEEGAPNCTINTHKNLIALARHQVKEARKKK